MQSDRFKISALIVLVILSAFLLGQRNICQIAPPEPTGSNVAYFKGVTNIPRPSNAGFAQLNADCHSAFPGTRLCTDRNILETFPAPVPGNDAWILATVVGGSALNSIGADLSPREFLSLNCAKTLALEHPLSPLASAGNPFSHYDLLTGPTGFGYVLLADGNFNTVMCHQCNLELCSEEQCNAGECFEIVPSEYVSACCGP